MGKLHELLAIESDLAHTAGHVVEEAITTFTKKADRFVGAVRKIEFYDESRSVENAEETKARETTVDEKLSYVARTAARYYDAVLQKDITNQEAKADLVVGGAILGNDLPATFLLGLEAKLSRLRNMYMVMPTLSPGVVWTADPDSGAGVFRSEPQLQVRTEKVIKPVVLYEATKEHPAQVREHSVDQPVARLESTQFSGMLTVNRKSQILDRLDTLIRAVKAARQRANNVDVKKADIGLTLFKYIHGD